MRIDGGVAEWSNAFDYEAEVWSSAHRHRGSSSVYTAGCWQEGHPNVIPQIAKSKSMRPVNSGRGKLLTPAAHNTHYSGVTQYKGMKKNIV